MGLMFKMKHRTPLATKTFDRAMPVFQYVKLGPTGQPSDAYLILWVANRNSNNAKLKWSQSANHNGPHARHTKYSIKEFTAIRSLRRTPDEFRATNFMRMTTNLLERILKEHPEAAFVDGGFRRAQHNLRPACLGYVKRNRPFRTVQLSPNRRQKIFTNIKSFNHQQLAQHVKWRQIIEDTDVWKSATAAASQKQPRLFNPATKTVRTTHQLVKKLAEWCQYVVSDLMGLTVDEATTTEKGYWRTVRVQPSDRTAFELTEQLGDYPITESD